MFDLGLNTKEIVARMRLSKTSVLRISEEHLYESKVRTRWISKILLPAQKEECVHCSNEFLHGYYAHPNTFLGFNCNWG